MGWLEGGQVSRRGGVKAESGRKRLFYRKVERFVCMCVCAGISIVARVGWRCRIWCVRLPCARRVANKPLLTGGHSQTQIAQ